MTDMLIDGTISKEVYDDKMIEFNRKLHALAVKKQLLNESINKQKDVEKRMAELRQTLENEEVLDEFDRVVGIERLKAIHLNDSKNPLGAKKDRHEKIGLGSLSLEGIKRIVSNPIIASLPICLETPNELDGYAKEIALLQDLVKDL